MTGGRTRPTHTALEIETLVSTTSVGEQTPKLTVEQRAIGDMADEQLVVVYRPAHAGDRPELALLERVLYGLHTI